MEAYNKKWSKKEIKSGREYENKSSNETSKKQKVIKNGNKKERE